MGNVKDNQMGNKTTKWMKYEVANLIDGAVTLFQHSFATSQFLPISGSVSSAHNKFMLVILDHLGDAVMATPAIQALKSSFPNSKLTIVTRPQNVPVFKHNPYVDVILTDEAPWWSEHGLMGSLSPRYWVNWLRKIILWRKESFDVIIDMRGDLRHLLLFGAAARPRILLGFARTGGAALLSSQVPYEPQMHEIKKKLALLKPLGVNELSPKPRIWVLPEEMEVARRRIRDCLGDAEPPIILMDPGAKPVQQWPLDRFAQVARAISSEIGKPVLVSAGPAYATLARDLVRLAGPKTACLSGRLDLRELIAQVAACDLVVSCDTGIAHIAGAVGTPAVTLFGPTVPERFWFGAKGARTLPSPLPCCHHDLHEICEVPGYATPGACMQAITPEMVIEAIIQTLLEVLPLVSTGA